MVYHEVVSQLPHRLRVMRMYRTGLRASLSYLAFSAMHYIPWWLLSSQELLNWSMSRHHWYPRAQALRLEFEENKDLVSPFWLALIVTANRICCFAKTDREQIWKLVTTGEELLSRFRHWEPILSESMSLSLQDALLTVMPIRCRARDAWRHCLLDQPFAAEISESMWTLALHGAIQPPPRVFAAARRASELRQHG